VASTKSFIIAKGDRTKEFYEGNMHTMKFYFRYELPHAAACAKTLLDLEYLTNVQKKEIFS